MTDMVLPEDDGLDEEAHFLARVAWHYYVEGINQQAVADRLGTNRLRINQALRDARKEGIVRITIESPFLNSVELEAQLRERFGLSRVRIVPSPQDPRKVQATVGAALAMEISPLIADPKIKRFGLSWGMTVYNASRFFRPAPRPDLEFVSLLGGIAQGSDVNSFDIIKAFAAQCDARRTYFTAPIYAPSKTARDAILGTDFFDDILERIRSVDACVIGAGDMSTDSLLIRYAVPSDINVPELVEAGAVGDIQGQFLSSEGKLIDHEINDRAIGIGIGDVANLGGTILAAGGSGKVPIIRAALKTGAFRCLVTDHDTAAAVLAYDTGEG
ncbi:sugar-binding transcriptional regulator [Chelativorans sp. YIM 93263]|uniref:sugar-binding transcriptional regulator n=1 Tax=Chelativorans sp. YIM 93263 TaxID=2906648 RepID=UPI002379A927|nr:sugar-binding domain-containing protein [Chelativorans sp. YIM 93263]